MKKQKKITQKEVRKHFSYNKETGVLKWKVPTRHMRKKVKAGDVAGKNFGSGYLQMSFKGVREYVHRIIWLGVKGYLPENDIDHINRIKNDNRWKNLREVSKSCNRKNCKISTHNTSGVTGVSFNKNTKKWCAYITLNKKKVFVGQSEDFDEVVCLRLAAEQCLNWFGCNSNSSAYQYVKENIQ